MDQSILPTANKYRKYFKSLEPIFENPETKNYSTVIFFFLVLSVFGWYAIRPTLQTILYLNREIKDKKEVTKKMDEKINALIEANVALESIQKDTPLLDEAIPLSPNVFSLVKQIRTIADTTTASLSAIQITNVALATTTAQLAAKKTTTEQTFPISLTANGSFSQLSAFLDNLINMRRIVSIDGFTISPMTSEEGTKSAQTPLEMTLKFTTYYGSQ